MRAFSAALSVIALATWSAGAQTIHRFSLPRHAATCGIGIAGDRTITGDNPLVSANGDSTPDAFTYRRGIFDHPAPSVPAGVVTFSGINTAHDILVVDLISSGPQAGESLSFLYSQGTTTPITWPNATNVQANGINDAGTIVGSYQPGGTNASTGFIDRRGKITVLANPAGQTLPTGISRSGRIIAGDVLSASFTFSAWIYQNGVFTAISPPGAVSSFVGGVNDTGTVSGTYFTSTTAPVSHGYLYRNGSYTLFDVPGAVSTQLGGLNEAGYVTGCYADAAGRLWGFFTKP